MIYEICGQYLTITACASTPSGMRAKCLLISHFNPDSRIAYIEALRSDNAAAHADLEIHGSHLLYLPYMIRVTELYSSWPYYAEAEVDQKFLGSHVILNRLVIVTPGHSDYR